MSDIDTAVADSLKVLDLKRPIREADMAEVLVQVRSGPIGDVVLAIQSPRRCDLAVMWVP